MTRTATTEWRACVTNAPEAYDYGYCIQVPWVEVEEGWRVVVIPLESFDYQTNRYLSGMYAFVELSAATLKLPSDEVKS